MNGIGNKLKKCIALSLYFIFQMVCSKSKFAFVLYNSWSVLRNLQFHSVLNLYAKMSN